MNDLINLWILSTMHWEVAVCNGAMCLTSLALSTLITLRFVRWMQRKGYLVIED